MIKDYVDYVNEIEDLYEYASSKYPVTDMDICELVKMAVYARNADRMVNSMRFLVRDDESSAEESASEQTDYTISIWSENPLCCSMYKISTDVKTFDLLQQVFNYLNDIIKQHGVTKINICKMASVSIARNDN